MKNLCRAGIRTGGLIEWEHSRINSNGMVFFIHRKNNFMKHLMQIIKRPLLAVVSVLMTVVAFAQDKKVDVDINTNSGGNWYAQPWVWIVGAAVFILLLV